ncbi:MAG: hypothetical protein F4W92_03925 [Gammaproteobacteria bacterium]|nr:hypothetical protein [Gammaproteobacteria bacterium]
MTYPDISAHPTAHNPQIKFRHISLAISCLAIGFGLGLVIRGLFFETELENARTEASISSSLGPPPDPHQTPAWITELADTSELNSTKIKIAFMYGAALGGAVDFMLWAEPTEVEVCTYITDHVTNSGVTALAKMPVGQDVREDAMFYIETTLRNADIDCSDVMDEW